MYRICKHWWVRQFGDVAGGEAEVETEGPGSDVGKPADPPIVSLERRKALQLIVVVRMVNGVHQVAVEVGVG